MLAGVVIAGIVLALGRPLVRPMRDPLNRTEQQGLITQDSAVRMPRVGQSAVSARDASLQSQIAMAGLRTIEQGFGDSAGLGTTPHFLEVCIELNASCHEFVVVNFPA